MLWCYQVQWWLIIADLPLPIALPSPSDLLTYLANAETVIGALYTAATLMKGVANLLRTVRKAWHDAWMHVHKTATTGDEQ